MTHVSLAAIAWMLQGIIHKIAIVALMAMGIVLSLLEIRICRNLLLIIRIYLTLSITAQLIQCQLIALKGHLKVNITGTSLKRI
jgi:hypothetical protein